MTYYQLNMFDDPQSSLTEYERCLVRGPLIAGGKFRVYAACAVLPSKELPKFLKNEYGIGGFSIQGGFFDSSASGLTISKWHEDINKTYKWNEVAKDIKRLISLDLYLTDKEKEYIEIAKSNPDGLRSLIYKYCNEKGE